jgi:hypothetical protein
MKPYLHAPDIVLIGVMEDAFRHLFPIHVGPVGAAQILNVVRSVSKRKLGVSSGNRFEGKPLQ